MWISRAQDSWQTLHIQNTNAENTIMDNNPLVRYLQTDFSISQDDANTLAALLQLERSFGEKLKNSDILYIKLKTLGFISYQ